MAVRWVELRESNADWRSLPMVVCLAPNVRAATGSA
jgi:hypothetical protein